MSQENGILLWKDPSDWNNAIKKLLKDCIETEIRTAIERNPTEYFYYEAQWSEELNIQCQNDNELPGYHELMQGFERMYPKIRMYHGCRTDDISSYLKVGLLTFDPKECIQKAKKIFLSGLFPNITEADIDTAAKAIANQGRENKICLALDDINLKESTPHYFKYGSESLRIIASRLPGISQNYEEILQNIGNPTIFVCDIPQYRIDKQALFHLLTELIRWTVCYPYKQGEEEESIDFTFTFTTNVDPSFITSYYHPI